MNQYHGGDYNIDSVSNFIFLWVIDMRDISYTFKLWDVVFYINRLDLKINQGF